MYNSAKFLLLLLLIVLLVACSKQYTAGSLIHEEKAGTASSEEVIEVAYNEEDYSELADFFNMEDDPPTVDFENDAVLFIATFESSCPIEVTQFQLSDDEKSLIIEAKQKGTTCDTYALPKLLLFQMDKEKLNSVESVSFDGESYPMDHE